MRDIACGRGYRLSRTEQVCRGLERVLKRVLCHWVWVSHWGNQNVGGGRRHHEGGGVQGLKLGTLNVLLLSLPLHSSVLEPRFDLKPKKSSLYFEKILK